MQSSALAHTLGYDGYDSYLHEATETQYVSFLEREAQAAAELAARQAAEAEVAAAKAARQAVRAKAMARLDQLR